MRVATVAQGGNGGDFTHLHTCAQAKSKGSKGTPHHCHQRHRGDGEPTRTSLSRPEVMDRGKVMEAPRCP